MVSQLADERRSAKHREIDEKIHAALTNEQITRMRVEAIEGLLKASFKERFRWLFLGARQKSLTSVEDKG